ncbi:MAG: hypothetical protein AAGD07_07360 [Planctomycetota bacterium]
MKAPFSESKTGSGLVASVTFALLLSLLAWSWGSGGIVGELLNFNLGSDERIEILKAYFRRLGWVGPLVYTLFAFVEVVVAPIPGLMLYAPGRIVGPSGNFVGR